MFSEVVHKGGFRNPSLGRCPLVTDLKIHGLLYQTKMVFQEALSSTIGYKVNFDIRIFVPVKKVLNFNLKKVNILQNICHNLHVFSSFAPILSIVSSCAFCIFKFKSKILEKQITLLITYIKMNTLVLRLMLNYLNQLDVNLKMLKVLVRVSYKKKYINIRNYESWCRKLNTVGTFLGF